MNAVERFSQYIIMSSYQKKIEDIQHYIGAIEVSFNEGSISKEEYESRMEIMKRSLSYEAAQLRGKFFVIG